MEKQNNKSINIQSMPIEEEVICKISNSLPPKKENDLRNLLHELHTSQVKIERHNEELRETQEKLMQSRDKYIDLFDFAPVGYVSLSKKGLILEVNLTFASLIERAKHTLLNRKISSFIIPEHRDLFYQHFREIKKTTKTKSCQCQLQRKNKSPVWVNISSARTSGSSAPPQALRLIITDIGEFKKTEDELRKSEKRFRLALDATSDGVFDRNLRTGEIYHGENWSQNLGYSLKDIKSGGITWGTLVHPEDEEKTLLAVQQHIEGHEPSYKAEFRMKQKNGCWKWLQARGKVVEWDEKNKPLRFVGVHTDITQQKLLEENLRASEQRFRSLAELSPAGIYLTDHKGNCTYVNKFWREMCGYTEEEAKGTGWIKAIHPDDQKLVSEAWQKMMKDGKQFAIEYRFISPNGQTPWVYGLARSISDSHGRCTGYVGINTDISFKKQAELELQISFAKLEKLVSKQTLELHKSNKELKKEIEVRIKIEQELLHSEAKLEEEKLNLEEINTTLRVLLKRGEEEKRRVEKQMQVNVSQIILPLIKDIKADPLTVKQELHFDFLESSLKKITSPFLQNISSLSLKLSPMEIKVAHLVKEGKTSKEIAENFNLSVDTINVHRKNIRKKCGIRGKDKNLRTVLMSFDDQDLFE